MTIFWVLAGADISLAAVTGWFLYHFNKELDEFDAEDH